MRHGGKERGFDSIRYLRSEFRDFQLGDAFDNALFHFGIELANILLRLFMRRLTEKVIQRKLIIPTHCGGVG